MKNILVIIFVCMGFCSSAQMKGYVKVPSAVKNAFSKKHPKVQRVAWEREKGDYEAGFSMDKKEMSELYNKDGVLIESEIEIAQTLLPSGVLSYVKAHYKGAKVNEAAKITDSKGVVTYEAAIKGLDLIFDPKGNFLREIKD